MRLSRVCRSFIRPFPSLERFLKVKTHFSIPWNQVTLSTCSFWRQAFGFICSKYSSKTGHFVLDYDSLSLLFYFTKSDFFLRMQDIVRRKFEISKK